MIDLSPQMTQPEVLIQVLEILKNSCKFTKHLLLLILLTLYCVRKSEAVSLCVRVTCFCFFCPQLNFLKLSRIFTPKFLLCSVGMFVGEFWIEKYIVPSWRLGVCH